MKKEKQQQQNKNDSTAANFYQNDMNKSVYFLMKWSNKVPFKRTTQLLKSIRRWERSQYIYLSIYRFLLSMPTRMEIVNACLNISSHFILLPMGYGFSTQQYDDFECVKFN